MDQQESDDKVELFGGMFFKNADQFEAFFSPPVWEIFFRDS